MLLLLLGLMASSAARMGGLGAKQRVNLGEEADHQGLFAVLAHEDVSSAINKLSDLPLRAVEYQTQVVAGIKYVVQLYNEEGEHFELHIWQKPFNSRDNVMPAPTVIKAEKIEEDL